LVEFSKRVQNEISAKVMPRPQNFTPDFASHSDDNAIKADEAFNSVHVRPFQFHRGSQQFIGKDDETLPVSIRVNNPDCSPLIVNC
jgi:hypothetical protein